MSTEENKALVRRYFEELLNHGNLAVADELITEGYQSTFPGFVLGPEGQKQLYQTYHASFPDLRVTIDDMIAEGDKVVTRLTVHGTHQGDFQGIPPTGKPVTVSGITIDRIADGKIQASWAQFDMLGLMQQLGAIPAPQQAAS